MFIEIVRVAFRRYFASRGCACVMCVFVCCVFFIVCFVCVFDVLFDFLCVVVG